MDNFKRELRSRIFYGLAYCVLVLVVLCVALISNVEDHATSFALGVSFGLLLVVVVYVIKCINALKNEAKLRALYIEETDERHKHIYERVGATGINVAIGVFSLAMLIANYYNPTVFMTLAAVTLFTVLLKCTLIIYYSKQI